MTEVQLSVQSQRRHDLDALRAFAMLLGIALHGAIPYAPGFPWAIQDSQSSPVFTWMFMIIHGFRMPLFFLISGYFTMMIWRQRGLLRLIQQRALRILLPCLLGLITILPLTRWLGALAAGSAANVTVAEESSQSVDTIAAVIRRADQQKLSELLVDKALANQPDPQFQVRPLAWAAMCGNTAAATLLLDAGADIEGRNADGSTALHGAAFIGDATMLQLLLGRGADAGAKNLAGDPPARSATADVPGTMFIWGLLQLPPRDPDAVAAGRQKCLQLLPPLPQVAANAEPDNLTKARDAYRSLLTAQSWNLVWSAAPGAVPFHLMLTPVFDHLWFLWFLCWMVLGFAMIVPVVVWAGQRMWPGRQVSRLLTIGWGWLCWLLPTAAVSCFMGLFGPAFGPDTSMGILPQPHVLLYYSLFFTFGCLYFESSDVEGRLGKWWWLTLPVALAVLLPLTFVVGDSLMLSSLLQAAYAWLMSFGCLGIFRRWMSHPSPRVRWLSDASYWLYLSHLPVLFVLQAPIRSWPVSSYVKFSLTCSLCTILLLLVYHWCVRETWIGVLLNGPRKKAEVK